VRPDGVSEFSPAHRTEPGVAFFRRYDEFVSQLSPRPELEPDFRDYEPIHPEPGWKIFLRKLWAPIVGLGAFLAKFGVVLLKFKFLFSMFVSAAIYVWIGGWWFGIGLIVLLFVHEMGHVIQLRREGLKASAPMFVPFLGAVVFAKSLGENALAEARVGLAGPILGTLGAAGCLAIGVATNSDLLRALAYVGFLLNLINLVPLVPFDGGRAMAAMAPSLWFVGLGVMVALLLLTGNPFLLIFVLLGGMETWRRWKLRGTRSLEQAAYYRVRPRHRLIVGAVYIGLIVALAVGMLDSEVVSSGGHTFGQHSFHL
jgi:Zn-dependent protease